VEKVSIGTPVVYGLVGPKVIDKVNFNFLCTKFFLNFSKNWCFIFYSLTVATATEEVLKYFKYEILFLNIRRSCAKRLKGKWVKIPIPISLSI
jgi:hypothetical protein